MLPPGRERPVTSPSATGSPPLAKTIGMAEVARFAASPGAGPPVSVVRVFETEGELN
jgi:hypothetical protein